MKNFLVLLMVMFAITSTAQNVMTHTVQRGETLESIAKKYNVTVEGLTKANPDAAKFFFTGMKLNIPNEEKVLPSTSIQTKQDNVENSSAHSSSQAPSTDYSPQYSEPSSSNLSASTDPQLIGGMDYTFMLKPDIKVYGLRMNWNGLGYKWLSMDWGMQHEFVKHGSTNGFLGIGLSPKYTIGPILIGAHLYPYVNLYSQYEIKGYYEKTGNPKGEDKTKVGYGGALDLMAGLKLFTTSGGTIIYLTGSYHVDAFEFKTKGAFKNGLWGIGLTFILPEQQ